MLITKLHTPEGVKDYLPKECEFKLNIEDNIKNTFKKCGFKPISSPTIEYYEVFENAGGVDSKRMYKFVDTDGTLLTLRPDLTPSIARIVATSVYDIPKKLYYVENAFRRNESYQGKLREFTQAGIEIIDSKDTLSADVEAVTLAIKALKSVGIEDFKIDLGHAMFLEGIIDDADVSDKVKEEIKEFILSKNYVAVAEIAENIENESTREFLKDLPLLIGGNATLESVKKRVTNEKSSKALDYLVKMYNILNSLGLEKYISFDFSVLGAMDYYTGVIFRGYVKGTGSSVINGGRYDNTVKRFGKNMPAVGFGIKINDLINVINCLENDETSIFIAYDSSRIKEAFELAENMRNDGLIVELSDLGDSYDDNFNYCGDRDLFVYISDSTECRILSDKDNLKSIVEKYNLL